MTPLDAEVGRIDSFFGDYRFLSNFWPVTVDFDGDEYPSVEHAYQASKTEDARQRRVIRDAASAGKAKGLGSQLPLAADWAERRLEIMRLLVSRKFADSELAEQLIATGNAVIVEGNRWGDRYWGVDGVGTNHLGNLLMVERARLRELPPPRLALDLEGTLVSNAVSLFARPGLHDFLDWTATRFEQRYLYTAVTKHRAEHSLEVLARHGDVPRSFSAVPVVELFGTWKDLRVIDPELGHLLLLDDQAVIEPTQLDRWVSIPSWDAPHAGDDGGLAGARQDLELAVARLEA